MSAAEAVTDLEAARLFHGLKGLPRLVLAISGGVDSTALMWLASRWREREPSAPKLVAVTIDHGLRPASAEEARAVAEQATRLGLPHRIVRWEGRKPRTGLQEQARRARYELLSGAAREFRARHIATAHTLEDQAETVLFRLCKGSGVAGLGGMEGAATGIAKPGMTVLRPLLSVGKARLHATLEAAGVPWIEDPSNADPRFTRARLRALSGVLRAEGLSPDRLARFAERARRADGALAWAVERAAADAVRRSRPHGFAIDPLAWKGWPEEIALRVLQGLIEQAGDEGPVELGKLEALVRAVQEACGSTKPFRRTLAGALVTVSQRGINVGRAPARTSRPAAAKRENPGPEPMPSGLVHQDDSVSSASLGTVWPGTYIEP